MDDYGVADFRLDEREVEPRIGRVFVLDLNSRSRLFISEGIISRVFIRPGVWR